jgi:uncharacterized NAD(P)/FAD-binding protein YdhS
LHVKPAPKKPLSYAALHGHNGVWSSDNGCYGDGFEDLGGRGSARQIAMKRKRVAIVGAGFSGVALAALLMRGGGRAADVLLIERGERFGPGLAYSTRHATHLLNVRASNMSALADDPDHFAQWLSARNGGPPTSFAPRRRYGAYVEDLLRKTERWRPFGSRLKRVRDEAVACRNTEEGWVVTLASGQTIDADAVLLALGHRPPSTLPAFEEGGVPMIGAWDGEALKRLPRGDVLLLGAGLTMVDVALTLAAKRKGTIYALSRRGLTPRPHLDLPRAVPSEPIDLPPQLSEAVRAFRREVRAMAAKGEPWQLAVDRLRAGTPRLWQALPVAAQRRFLRHLRPWWDVHRHRAAPEIAAQVKALQSEGRLRVLAGEIIAATPHARGYIVHHRPRGSLVRHKFDVAGVVNCTGGNLDLTRAAEPLVAQLLSEGVARPHANGLGMDVDADGRVIGADGAPQQGLYTIGALTQGAFWESTAAPEIRVRAAAIAELI